MKKTYINILVPLMLPFLYYVIFTGFRANENSNSNIGLNNLPPGPSSQKDFVNFILNSDYGDYSGPGGKHMENFLSQYRSSLNFNGVHLYDNDTGTTLLGWFNKDIEGYQQTHMNNLITGAHNESLKAIYERSNISNLCYAQRLVYEVASGSGHNDVNDGFCYQNISGLYETEPDGTTSIHACVNPNECNVQGWDAVPQYICSNIYENLQHTDLPNFRPQKRDVWDWHLKPRMKIKQSDFTPTDTRPVVTIKAYSFDNTEIASKTILVKNFSNTTSYNGNYVEKYFDGALELSMWILGDGTNGLNKGRNEDWSNWGTIGHARECHVDFKIYWHGNVDVWFDKLTVDDYRANKLFSGNVCGCYDDFIRYFASPNEFLKIAGMVKKNEFRTSSYTAVNYVMNIMYDKLQFKAIPISLKNP